MLSRRELVGAGSASVVTVAEGVQRARVVFVRGDHEYSGEFTVPILARDLTRLYSFDCVIVKSAPDPKSYKTTGPRRQQSVFSGVKCPK